MLPASCHDKRRCCYGGFSADCVDENQVDLVRGYSSNDEVAHFLNSTLNKKEIKEVHDDLLSGKTKLLYVAPETLTKQENLEFLPILKFPSLQLTKHIVSLSGDMIFVLSTEGCGK